MPKMLLRILLETATQKFAVVIVAEEDGLCAVYDSAMTTKLSGGFPNCATAVEYALKLFPQNPFE